jgi:hypothetical protein
MNSAESSLDSWPRSRGAIARCRSTTPQNQTGRERHLPRASEVEVLPSLVAEPAPQGPQPLMHSGEFAQQASNRDHQSSPSRRTTPTPGIHPFLPHCLQYLDVLARGGRAPFETSDLTVSTLFERRTADAFRGLGFEVTPFGQGTGRKPAFVALAPRDRFAVIIDAKVRSAGYVVGTEDRKFLEYARERGADLRRQGFAKVYFVVVGPSFKESDLKKLTEYFADSPISSIDLLTAPALMRMIEESTKERNQFSLEKLSRELFGHKVFAT